MVHTYLNLKIPWAIVLQKIAQIIKTNYKSKDYVIHIWNKQHSEKPHHSPNKFTITNHPQYLIGHLSRGLMQQQSAKYLKVYISQDFYSLYVPSKFLTHPATNGGCQLSNQQNIT